MKPWIISGGGTATSHFRKTGIFFVASSMIRANYPRKLFSDKENGVYDKTKENQKSGVLRPTCHI